MVVACYANGAESYASQEVCAELKRDIPVITNVSVNTTSVTGEVFIQWSKPTELDTLESLPPYQYRVLWGSGNSLPNVQIASFTKNNWYEMNDTFFVHTNINTQDNTNSYKIELYHNDNYGGSSQKANSPYLSLIPNDNQLELTWTQEVPWTNYQYVVYKKIGEIYDSIATVSQTSYIDTGLTNGSTYCYYVKSIGSYSDTTIFRPLINLSQRQCGQPKDLTPPCPPIATLVGNCDKIENTLQWTNPNNICSDDVIQYKIYKTDVYGGDYYLVTTINSQFDTSFIHKNIASIAGCYYVTALDSFANESKPSDTMCVDNCPVYTLPNVFTPNGDNENDLFVPFPYKFIKDIDLHIYNRWGNEVYTTKDPNIKWNGICLDSKQLCDDGVYFYVCTVNEIRLSGIQSRKIKGTIQVFIENKSLFK
jgi:gliding motility-associated-like protein